MQSNFQVLEIFSHMEMELYVLFMYCLHIQYTLILQTTLKKSIVLRRGEGKRMILTQQNKYSSRRESWSWSVHTCDTFQCFFRLIHLWHQHTCTGDSLSCLILSSGRSVVRYRWWLLLPEQVL